MDRILGYNLKEKENELMAEIIWNYHTYNIYTSVLIAGVLPEGIVHELPVADDYPKAPVTETVGPADDLEELRRQLEALNAD